MRGLLLLLATCASLSAIAAPPEPSCAPIVPYGRQALGTKLEVYQEKNGWHFYWACESEVGVITWHGYACSYEGGECNTLNGVRWMRDIYVADDYLAKLKAGWASITYDCDAAATLTGWQKTICDEHNWRATTSKAEWMANVQPAVWQVKPSGTATTRPAYALVGGVRGTKEMARATIGAPCDPARPYLLSSADAWMVFDASGYVALCARMP